MLAWDYDEECSSYGKSNTFAELQPLINEWYVSLDVISTAVSIIQQRVIRRSNQGAKTIAPRTNP